MFFYLPHSFPTRIWNLKRDIKMNNPTSTAAAAAAAASASASRISLPMAVPRMCNDWQFVFNGNAQADVVVLSGNQQELYSQLHIPMALAIACDDEGDFDRCGAIQVAAVILASETTGSFWNQQEPDGLGKENRGAKKKILKQLWRGCKVVFHQSVYIFTPIQL